VSELADSASDPATGLVELYSSGSPRSAPLQVADALREVILRSAEGELLGSEQELIARFGVSQPTFRQAARILQAEGLLIVRRGVHGGLFARLPTSAGVARSVSVLLRHRGVTFHDLSNAIQALTGEMARQAAAHPRVAARRRLARDIHAFAPPQDTTEAGRVIATSAHFGRAVATLAPNPVVTVLLQMLIELVAHQRDVPRSEGHYDEVRTFQHAVADAIAAGDELVVLQLCSGFRAQTDHWRR
jgi:DNA-binding FadR family transcriptional regulator